LDNVNFARQRHFKDVVPSRHDIALINGHWNGRRVWKDKAYAMFAIQAKFRYDRLEVMAVGAQAM
jgi:hypothetical protein